MATLEPLRFRRIMVPVDESKPSQNSLAVAAGLARETGAQVILTHVVQMRWSQDEPELRATYGEIVDDYRASGEETHRKQRDLLRARRGHAAALREQPGKRAAAARKRARDRRHSHGQPRTRAVRRDDAGFG